MAAYTQLLVVNTNPQGRRKANFSRAEIDALVAGYKTYRTVIERRCAGVSKSRSEAWDLITQSLFAVSGVRRTTAEVRKKWADLKSLNKKGASCGVTAGNLLAEAALFNNLNELVIGMPVEECLLGSSTEAPSSAGADESSDNTNTNIDVKQEPPSSPGEAFCDNRSSDPEPEHEGSALHIDEEVPCNSRSTQTSDPSSQDAGAAEEEEASELLKTQKEILHVLKRLAKAQERLVQLKAWKYGVKLTDDGISDECQSSELGKKNGLQAPTSAPPM
ncbi:hypothetical protein MTO96_002842 [Rhipicephalus appendiculatus]